MFDDRCEQEVPNEEIEAKRSIHIEGIDGRQAANHFSDILNASGGKKWRNEFAKRVVDEKDRDLSKFMMDVIVATIDKWADAYKNDRFDLRNEQTVKVANTMIQSLSDDDRSEFLHEMPEKRHRFTYLNSSDEPYLLSWEDRDFLRKDGDASAEFILDACDVGVYSGDHDQRDAWIYNFSQALSQGTHRTLQQLAMGTFVEILVKWSEHNDDLGHLAKKMIESVPENAMYFPFV